MRGREALRYARRWYWPRQQEALWEAALSGVVGARIWSRTTRPGLLRAMGVQVGADTGIASQVTITARGTLTIGARCFINTGVLLDCRAQITLGDDVHVGPGARLLTSSHEVGDTARRAGAGTSAPVHIGAGTWIGAGALILPGVQVGSGCVVAAGAVVVRDCAPDGLYAGVPATRVRSLGPG